METLIVRGVTLINILFNIQYLRLQVKHMHLYTDESNDHAIEW